VLYWAVCILGCQGPEGPAGEIESQEEDVADPTLPGDDAGTGQDLIGEGFGDFFSGEIHPADCGVRNVREIPASVTLEETQLEVHTIDPRIRCWGESSARCASTKRVTH
jgi:hypothetical protein